MSGLLGDADEPAVQKPAVPDYANYWKQYRGWIQNINDRTTGQLADVRARLSAAGASPDQLMMQTEHLESQRKSELAKLEGGQTKRFLDEAYAIATGKKANPYATDLPGMEMEEYDTGEVAVAFEGTDAEPARPGGPVMGKRPKALSAASMEEYFNQYFGDGSTAPEVDAGANAKKRAKMAASGGKSQGAGAPSGDSGSVASAVFGSTDDTFWR